jgi:N utilization substance protein A
MAVYSNREDVDPVGACVGLKGVRIQAVVRELEGEKIDVLRYDPDPRSFIKNALLPAEVEQVIILDEGKKSALAVVQENQFSLAIGKQGLNVRLANRLVDWNIDVKTVQQFAEMDLSAETKKAVSALFGEIEPEEEITRINELPGLPERLVEVLKADGIEFIESLVSLTEKDIAALKGISPEDAQLISRIIAENIEIVEEAEAKPATEEAPAPAEKSTAEPSPAPAAAETSEAQGSYQCPECGAAVRPDMTACPNCGVGLSFEEEQGE